MLGQTLCAKKDGIICLGRVGLTMSQPADDRVLVVAKKRVTIVERRGIGKRKGKNHEQRKQTGGSFRKE